MKKYVNRNYKDKLFRMIFREKEELLSLYNSVNQSHYTDPQELQIVTLENAIYMSMKNDIAFLIDCSLNLYEHQSTFSPNLPLRNLFYVAYEYQNLTKEQSFYASRQILLPSPRFVVFYNGTQQQPERRILKLSDAYQLPPGKEKDFFEPELELKVTMLNINSGNNTELLEACQTLKEYMLYVERVRSYAKNMSLEEAVDRAIDECIRENILSSFLSKYRVEAKAMSIFEYDEEKELALYRQAERKEGEDAGLTKGKTVGLKALVNTLKPILPDFEAVYKAIVSNEEYADITKEEIKKYY